MSSEKASEVKREGHAAESEFAKIIDGKIYSSGRKKDVVDKKGDLHSVKSGDQKWQIFLFGGARFQKEIDFQASDLLLECIKCFPIKREDYLKNKVIFKKRLSKKMNALKKYLCSGRNKLIFFKKSFLNNGEVDYITVKEGRIFHVFDGEEVINLLDHATEVVNSTARRIDQFDNQKVVFKLKGAETLGEVEMRNDSDIHYRELKFWVSRPKMLSLLIENIFPLKKCFNNRIFVYGKATKKFKEL